jgi:transcriptional regulator with XRE-family HTH domain
MASYSPEELDALGAVVKRLRTKKRLTQEQLGRAADYGGGAAVSISRLENGKLEPTPEKFKGVATALGLTAEELAELALHESHTLVGARSGGSESTKTRVERVRTEIDGRAQLVANLEHAFQEAHDRSRDRFLMRLVGIAGQLHVLGRPVTRQLTSEDPTEGDSAKVEAAYAMRFTKFGVAQALAANSGWTTGSAAAYPAFVAAVAGSAALVAGSAALAGTAAPGSAGASPTNGLIAALRVGTPVSYCDGSLSSVGAVSGQSTRIPAHRGLPVITAAVVDALVSLQRNRRQMRELAAELDEVEAALAQSQRNVALLRDLMPVATETLDYVAVHAAHALERWERQLGSDQNEAESLGKADQQRYEDFVEVAAAQLSVAALDFGALMTSHGQELEHAAEFGYAVLAQAREIITSHV